MKTFKITVPKVHCVKKNDFLNKDKIFLVMIVTSAKLNETPKIIFSGITGTTKFKKNDMKLLNLGTSWKFQVNDDEVFNISFGLYEQDNGDLYEKYQQEITEISSPENMKYMDIITSIWDGIKDKITTLNLTGLIQTIPAIGLEIIQKLRFDDLIGKRSLTYILDSPELQFAPEFDLKDSESHYKLQLTIEEI